jgi:hypothetical protein
MELTPLRITQKGQGEALFAPVACCSQVERRGRTIEFTAKASLVMGETRRYFLLKGATHDFDDLGRPCQRALANAAAGAQRHRARHRFQAKSI